MPATTHRPSAPRGRTARRLALIGAGVALALALSACSSSPAAAPPTTAATSATGSGTPATTDAITIKNFMFSPATLTVGPGATVSVTNKDSVTHTLTSDTGLFNSGDVAAGATVHFTAPRTPGTYRYRCTIHQFMTATLRVS